MVRLRNASQLLVALVVITSGAACKTAAPAAQAGREPSGKVLIRYGGNAQAEIIGPAGQRVLIDVWDPDVLSAPASAQDVLLTTHHHPDHFSGPFQGGFKGPQLDAVSGRLDLPGGGVVTGIASAHGPSESIDPAGGSNNLFLIELGGLRIAHFGDIGQEALSAEQLAKLGRVDVLLTQLANPYSDMDAENQRGIKLIEQVKPRLVIPTHYDPDAAKVASKRWPALCSQKDAVSLDRAALPEATTIVFVGELGRALQKPLQLPPATF